MKENARQVGAYLKSGLAELKLKHKLIGDIRGLGLFLGIELVRNLVSLEPAPEEAKLIIEEMKERGILLSIDGPLHNVIKIKPPLIFSEQNADRLIENLDQVLNTI